MLQVYISIYLISIVKGSLFRAINLTKLITKLHSKFVEEEQKNELSITTHTHTQA
jgi:hypothetical protein